MFLLVRAGQYRSRFSSYRYLLVTLDASHEQITNGTKLFPRAGKQYTFYMWTYLYSED